MNPSQPEAEAMGIEGGRVTAIGTVAEVQATLGASVRTIDMHGRTILPGFIDTHTHVEMTALSRHVWTDVRGKTREEILEIVHHQAQNKPWGEWIIAQATFGQDLPNKEELNAAAPNHPVAVRWSMHKFIVNQQALDAGGLTRSSIMPIGMRFQKNSDGTLNGVLEEAWDLLPIPELPQELLTAALEETLHAYFLANGVTTVHEIGYTAAGIQTLRELANTCRAPRMGILLTVAPGHQPLATLSKDHDLPLDPRSWSDRFRYHGYKIFVDGGRDGAFRSNQLEEPADQWGLLTRLYPKLVEELHQAMHDDMQVYVHAIGDLAQEIAISALERIHETFPNLDHRIRIEHFFNEHRDTKDLERLIAAGGIAAPNPGFVIAEPDDPRKRQPVGAEKYALKTLVEHQGFIPGNSDTAGAQPFTTNPWFTIRCMLELKNKNGVEINPTERIGLDTALRAFTLDAAYSTRLENERGSLERGKVADFIVIDRDPFNTPTSDLTSIKTLATVIGGEVAYGALA